jgi:hypothetical protein
MIEQSLPLIRGLLARGSHLPLLTVAGDQPDAKPDASPVDDATFEAWRTRFANLPADATEFELDGLGKVQVYWPARYGRATGKVAHGDGSGAGLRTRDRHRPGALPAHFVALADINAAGVQPARPISGSTRTPAWSTQVCTAESWPTSHARRR